MKVAVVAMSVLGALRLTAQTPAQSRLLNALPTGVRATQLVVSTDTQRVYFTDSTRALWLYIRATNAATRLADAEVWDLTIGAKDKLLAYRRVDRESGAQHIFVLPVDARTGVAAGRERRVSAMEGDSPAISPDGKSIAFARDDSVGVGQGVVVASLNGGRELTVVPVGRSGIGSIRWALDGRSLIYTVNPPVVCFPDWSCLPYKNNAPSIFGSLHRVPATGGASTTIVARAATGWPGPSPDGSLIVYADTGFSGRLVVADSTGRTLTTITPPGRETIEGWLPPATLVFSDRGDTRRLLTLPIAGGTPRLLLDTLPPFFEPVWSPNSESFSMTACLTEQCEMRIWSADGTLRRTVSLPDRYVGGALWSPDGAHIGYFGGTTTNNRHLSVIDVVAGTVRQGAMMSSNSATFLWTADSRSAIVANTTGGSGAQRKVVFQSVDVDGTARTLREFVIGATPSVGMAISPTIGLVMRSGELHRVVFAGDSADAVVVPKTNGRYNGIVAVSPAGERVVLRHSADSTGDVQTLEVLTSDARPVATIETPFPIVGSMRMLPRGDQLVVFGLPSETEPEAALYLVDVTTKQSRKIAPIPLRQATGDLAVSPDGRTLLYTLTGTTSPRVFTMDLSTLKSGGRR